MKKILSVFVLSFLISNAYSQQLISATLLRSWTTNQVDSAYNAAGLPTAILPNEYPVKLYKVLYNTVSYDSTTPTTATGLMVVPQGTQCTPGLLVYDHGTITRKSDAPSRLKGEYVVGLVIASHGLIALLPDYLGLGDGPGLHPYQHARSEATATIDMMRASREYLSQSNYLINEQVFLTGYSQGGHAAMATHKMIQEHFSQEFNVTASCPMSGAYSMSRVMWNVMLSDNPYPAPYYLPYLILSYRMAYNLYPNISDVFKAPYDTTIPPKFNGMFGPGAIDNLMPALPKQIVRDVLLDTMYADTNHFFRQHLKENDNYNWKPDAPVRLLYCKSDQHVNYMNTIEAGTYMNQVGAANVRMKDIDSTLDHTPCAQFAMLYMKNFFDSLRWDRFTVNYSTQPTYAGQSVGSAQVSITAGKAPFTYLWSTGDTTASVSGLASGIYDVTVTGSDGCPVTISVPITELSSVSESSLTASYTLMPNPVTDKFNLMLGDPSLLNASVQLRDITGKTIVSTVIRQMNEWFDVSALSPGMYIVTLTATGQHPRTTKIIIR